MLVRATYFSNKYIFYYDEISLWRNLGNPHPYLPPTDISYRDFNSCVGSNQFWGSTDVIECILCILLGAVSRRLRFLRLFLLQKGYVLSATTINHQPSNNIKHRLSVSFIWSDQIITSRHTPLHHIPQDKITSHHTHHEGSTVGSQCAVLVGRWFVWFSVFAPPSSSCWDLSDDCSYVSSNDQKVYPTSTNVRCFRGSWSREAGNFGKGA